MTHTEARELANKFGSRMCDENGDTHGEELYCFSLDDIIALKEALAQRKPLSAEQVSEICAEWTDENGNTNSFGRRQIARAIEAAHGIKENT